MEVIAAEVRLKLMTCMVMGLLFEIYCAELKCYRMVYILAHDISVVVPSSTSTTRLEPITDTGKGAVVPSLRRDVAEQGTGFVGLAAK